MKPATPHHILGVATLLSVGLFALSMFGVWRQHRVSIASAPQHMEVRQ